MSNLSKCIFFAGFIGTALAAGGYADGSSQSSATTSQGANSATPIVSPPDPSVFEQKLTPEEKEEADKLKLEKEAQDSLNETKQEAASTPTAPVPPPQTAGPTPSGSATQ